MLAGKFVKKHIEKLLPLVGQLKYDGIRVFIRDGVAYTRSLKPVRSTNFQSWVAWNKDSLEGMDGEIICGEPTASDCYRRTMKFTMSYDAPDEFTFYVFDKWDEPDTFENRFSIVEYTAGLFLADELSNNSFDLPKMVAAETVNLPTMEEVWYFHNDMISQGHEGIILRKADSYYKFGRGSPTKGECTKMKEGGWVDTEVKILAFYEEMHNANVATIDNLGHTERSGHKENLIGKETLGSIEVSGKFGDNSEFTCRVGTGLDNSLRRTIWNNREKYKSKIMKIKYFNVGIKDKPRFPVFLGFRDPDDMDAEQQGDLFS